VGREGGREGGKRKKKERKNFTAFKWISASVTCINITAKFIMVIQTPIGGCCVKFI
jgi:hypothetical protein